MPATGIDSLLVVITPFANELKLGPVAPVGPVGPIMHDGQQHLQQLQQLQQSCLSLQGILSSLF
ncbi:MAG: hypothetical protein ACI8WT_003868 [Clostridium sp.]